MWKQPQAPSLPRTTAQRSVKVLLDPGHSTKRIGAMDKSKSITEHQCNLIQAESLKAALERLGIKAEIADSPTDDLEAIGAQAKGFDAFISLHLNAFNQDKNYTCVKVDSRYTQGNMRNTAFAGRCAEAMAESLGLAAYHGAVYPRGVMPDTLRVLSAAHKVKCPIVFLTEAFFLDCYSDINVIRAMINTATKALAIELRGFL